LKLCDAHWTRVRDAFGATDYPDVKQRLFILQQRFGVDPWMMTAMATTTFLFRFVDPVKVGDDPIAVQALIEEEAGGCPVCFAGDTLLDASLEHVRALIESRQALGQTRPLSS